MNIQNLDRIIFTRSDGVGQVLKRSSGVWHSECFPTPIESPQEAVKICRTMGYVDGAILPHDKIVKYGDAMVPVYDGFFKVQLNPQQSMHMRADNPLVGLERSKDVCHRAFVKCTTELHR